MRLASGVASMAWRRKRSPQNLISTPSQTWPRRRRRSSSTPWSGTGPSDPARPPCALRQPWCAGASKWARARARARARSLTWTRVVGRRESCRWTGTPMLTTRRRQQSANPEIKNVIEQLPGIWRTPWRTLESSQACRSSAARGRLARSGRIKATASCQTDCARRSRVAAVRTRSGRATV